MFLPCQSLIKICVCILVSLLLILPTANSSKMTFQSAPGTVRCYTLANKTNQDFIFQIVGSLGFKSSGVTIQTVLSKDIQLIEGDLNWSGSSSKSYEIDRHLKLRINQNGYHKVTTTISATNVKDAEIDAHLPNSYTMYFYATDGFLSFSQDSVDFSQQIRDSLCFPVEEIRRRAVHRGDSLKQLSMIDVQLFSKYHLSHSFNHLDDSSYSKAVLSPYQRRLISDHYLITTNLKPNCDSLVQSDTIVNIDYSKLSPEIRYQVAQTGLAQLKALVALDHQILKLPEVFESWPYLSELEHLLNQRRVLMRQHIHTIDSISGIHF